MEAGKKRPAEDTAWLVHISALRSAYHTADAAGRGLWTTLRNTQVVYFYSGVDSQRYLTLFSSKDCIGLGFKPIKFIQLGAVLKGRVSRARYSGAGIQSGATTPDI